MDVWKFYSIRERLHTYCNPLSKERLESLLNLLHLGPNSTVLDIACGRGEFLIRLAELYRITGVGVDISPYFAKEAQTKAKQRVPNAPLVFLQLDAKNYKPPEGELFDLTSCIGATWIWNGYNGTLEALKSMTKRQGIVIVGEPYWLKPPDPEYLKWDNMKSEDFANSHYDNIKAAEALGLICMYTIVSTQQDFDHYENLGWWAITQYAEANATDPDLPEILERMKREKHVYLRWQRDTLGWALYVFRKP